MSAIAKQSAHGAGRPNGLRSSADQSPRATLMAGMARLMVIAARRSIDREPIKNAVAAILVLALPLAGIAQGFSSKPIRVVVPWPPGGRTTCWRAH